jgi:hypothetical protein
MPRSLARLSASASSHRNLSSAVFITNIAESDFSVHTPGPHPAHLPRSIRESDQVDAGTSSRGLAGSPSPIMEPRNACRFTKFNVQGRNRGIPPIDEPSEHRFAPGGQLCAEQRQLRGSTGVPLRLANFRRTATIPSKKRNLKRSSAGGCP